MKQPLNVTPYSLAIRYLGMREAAGAVSNPAVLAMLRRISPSVVDDETPWCSAFADHIAWLLGCARPNSLAARSWLTVGTPVDSIDAERGFHVVVLARGGGQQPGPHVLSAPGHVGFFDGWEEPGRVRVLAGNQGDAVSIAAFPIERILGIREI